VLQLSPDLEFAHFLMSTGALIRRRAKIKISSDRFGNFCFGQNEVQGQLLRLKANNIFSRVENYVTFIIICKLKIV